MKIKPHDHDHGTDPADHEMSEHLVKMHNHTPPPSLSIVGGYGVQAARRAHEREHEMADPEGRLPTTRVTATFDVVALHGNDPKDALVAYFPTTPDNVRIISQKVESKPVGKRPQVGTG